MASLNKVMLIGNLGRDPETSFTPGGLAVCKISLATTDIWNDKATGEKREKTEWHRVTFFGKQAETIGKYMTKGKQLYVEGRLQTSSYEKDGIKRYSTDIIASGFQFLGQLVQAGGIQQQQPFQGGGFQQQPSQPQQGFGYQQQPAGMPPQNSSYQGQPQSSSGFQNYGPQQGGENQQPQAGIPPQNGSPQGQPKSSSGFQNSGTHQNGSYQGQPESNPGGDYQPPQDDDIPF